MTAVHLSRIGGGAVVGSLLGILLHFVFGISLVPAAPRRMPAPAAASKDAAPGILEKERLASAYQKRVDELSTRIAAAEQECADLRGKIAAVPARPAESAREAKIRKFGGVMVRMVRIGAVRRTPHGTNVELKPETMAEAQRLMGEVFALASELGIDLQDQTAFFKNPEIVSGLFEGMLAECGIAVEEADLQAWRTRVADRIASSPRSTTGLTTTLLALALQEEFLDRFGLKLMQREPGVASMLGNLGTSTALGSSEETTAVAARLFLDDLAKAARLKDTQSSALLPTLEAWASHYAQLLAETRAKEGDAVVDGLLKGGTSGKSAEEQLAHLRNRIRLQSQILQLQSRTLEAVAGQLDAEGAKRVLRFEKAYYFGRLKP
jgi:hypothetical protein